eukprot:gnl/TRDRNA2_/TRDRNA2_133786_c0_seq1.p1 gnl/TRDRNA2_/TRDRNA2_133786_c0~~gnl/TRDRNA2_/TRDRNA2_133786_c0_seq1.p1  ORF type:complete len:244 (-),score=73.01 gnl/TRDRNA2_/TRDRNA2_133786_c0_seq1:36-719(-)
MADAAGDDEEVLIEELDPEDVNGSKALANETPEARSALASSKEQKKELSYYYCQEGSKDAKEYFGKEAVIRENDPLFRADGLGPKELNEKKEIEMPENVKVLDKYSWADEGESVKIYVEFPESIKDAEVQCQWGRFSVRLVVRQKVAPASGGAPNVYGLRIQEHEDYVLEHERKNGFCHEIEPDKCKHRIASSGQRITLTVRKKFEKDARPETWYELQKKSSKDFNK